MVVVLMCCWGGDSVVVVVVGDFFWSRLYCSGPFSLSLALWIWVVHVFRVF